MFMWESCMSKYIVISQLIDRRHQMATCATLGDRAHLSPAAKRNFLVSEFIAPKGLLCRELQKIMCVRPFVRSFVRSSVRPSVRMFLGPFLDRKIPVSPLIVPFGRSKKGSRA